MFATKGERKFEYVSLLGGMKMIGYIEGCIIITLIYFVVYLIYLKNLESRKC